MRMIARFGDEMRNVMDRDHRIEKGDDHEDQDPQGKIVEKQGSSLRLVWTSRFDRYSTGGC